MLSENCIGDIVFEYDTLIENVNTFKPSQVCTD